MAYAIAKVIATECASKEALGEEDPFKRCLMYEEEIKQLKEQIMEMQDEIDNLETAAALKDL